MRAQFSVVVLSLKHCVAFFLPLLLAARVETWSKAYEVLGK